MEIPPYRGERINKLIIGICFGLTLLLGVGVYDALVGRPIEEIGQAKGWRTKTGWTLTGVYLLIAAWLTVRSQIPPFWVGATLAGGLVAGCSYRTYCSKSWAKRRQNQPRLIPTSCSIGSWQLPVYAPLVCLLMFLILFFLGFGALGLFFAWCLADTNHVNTLKKFR